MATAPSTGSSLRLPSPSLVVLVGPAAAGKTTWAEANFAPHQVVSSDRLRLLVGEGEDDQRASPTPSACSTPCCSPACSDG